MDRARVSGGASAPALSALVLVGLLGACQGQPSTKSETWRDESPHEVGDVEVNGVRLNYADWGGTGEAVVLIPGSGNPPHVYDELAPRLTDHFRVLSYARRGDVRSEDRGPYDVDTMVEDLRQFLDHFGIERAHLVGWSLGGYELTRFAELYPERVGKLVYLDAGYDWYASPDLFASMPALAWPPAAADLVSLDIYATWFTERSIRAGLSWSSNAVQAYARDYLVEDEHGSLHFLAPDSAGWAARDSDRATYRPNFAAVTAPAIGVYVPDFLPVVGNPERRQTILTWTEEWWRPFQAGQQGGFEAALPGARIFTLSGGNHMSFPLTHYQELLGIIRGFLVEEG